VDGKRSSATQEITAGKHVVAVLARGHEPEVHELTLARGEEKTLAIDLEKTAQRRAVPWILIGSGAFAVTGIITTILAVHYDGVMSDIDDKRTTMGIDDGELGRYRTATRRRDLFRTTAFITGGTAIVLGGIGLGLYIFDQPDATGLGVGGRF
jgi:hypothetical protein